jgi:hypothetical protein
MILLCAKIANYQSDAYSSSGGIVWVFLQHITIIMVMKPDGS